MKRFACLILTIIVCFALYGCSSNNALSHSSDEHYIEVLDMELVQVDNGIYKPNLKVRCLFPENKAELYPEQLRIYLNYLDDDGFAVQKAEIHIKHLGYNEGVWTENTGMYMDDFNFDIAKVKSVSVTGYRFVSLKDGDAVYNEEFTFSPSISFDISKLLPESDILPSSASSVVVEEAYLDGNAARFSISAKVRNMGQVKRDVIEVDFQLLDSNGDAIGTGSIIVKDLEPGQAGKGGTFTVSKCNYNDISSIKFLSYSFGTFSGGSKNVWNTAAGDGGYFEEPYVFSFN